MTDYEPYVHEPTEAVPPPPLARLRSPLSWLAVALIAAALVFLWLQGSGTEDPSLNVPADQLTASPAPGPADPEAPAPDAPAPDPAAAPTP